MKKRLFISVLTAFALAAPMVSASGSDGLGDKMNRLGKTETIQLAQSCSGGLKVCQAGSYGPGGCYKPGYATCTAGLVCTGGMKACKPSNGGPAYCYKQGYGKCN